MHMLCWMYIYGTGVDIKAAWNEFKINSLFALVLYSTPDRAIMLPVIIPFVLLLAILPLPLVPYHEPAAEDHSAVIKTGLPTDPSNGPMYAELAEGMTISNNVKVFFKDYTTRYYYCVEDNNGILSVTTVSIHYTFRERLYFGLVP